MCFDTLQSAKANNADVVIIDTAGRMHNKVNLKNELTKIKNVMTKNVMIVMIKNVMILMIKMKNQKAINL